MFTYRNLMTVCSAAVLAIGLAACGGGDDDDKVSTAAGPTQEERTMAQVAALQGQINALREQLGLEPDDNLGDSVADLQGQVADLSQQLKDRQDAEDAAAAEARKARLGNLATAIGVVDSTAPTAHVRSTTAKPATATDGDPPHAIRGWTGASYSVTNADRTSVMTAVYNNKAAPAPTPFNEAYTILDTGDNEGRVQLSATDAMDMSIPDLPTHQSHPGVDIGPVNGVQGTLNGVSGTFLSSATDADGVNVGVDAEGNPTWTGDLFFRPDSATATVMVPDSDFLNLGWWLTMDADGEIDDVHVAAWATGETYANATFSALIGKATFQGIAVGKYTHRTIDTIYGGHFNADAELVADFGADNVPGMLSGTIDNFQQDGTPLGSGWRVTLGGAPATDGDPFDPQSMSPIDPNLTGGGIGVTGVANNAQGTFGDQKTLGTWNALFADGGRRDDMPGGVVGQFHIGEANHPINMVGAFAASNQEADLPAN